MDNVSCPYLGLDKSKDSSEKKRIVRINQTDTLSVPSHVRLMFMSSTVMTGLLLDRAVMRFPKGQISYSASIPMIIEG